MHEALQRIGDWYPDWLPTFTAKAKQRKRYGDLLGQEPRPLPNRHKSNGRRAPRSARVAGSHLFLKTAKLSDLQSWQTNVLPRISSFLKPLVEPVPEVKILKLSFPITVTCLQAAFRPLRLDFKSGAKKVPGQPRGLCPADRLGQPTSQPSQHGLFDLVRQLGFPDVYWTLAPYQRSLPYHTFLLDEMQKLLCERMKLPALESMHLAYTMFQICRGFLAGRSTSKGKAWTQHLLGSKLPGFPVDQLLHSAGISK